MTDVLPEKGASIDAFTGKIWHCQAEELLAALPSDSVDFICVDPPYGNNNGVDDLAGARARDGVKGGRSKGRILSIANDDFQSWEKLIPHFFDEAHRVINTNGAIACFVVGGGGEKTHFAQAILWLEQKARFFHALIWDKSARGYGLGWRYRRNYEMILIAGKRGGKIGWADNREAQPNVVYFQPTENTFHPTMKPLDLISWLIENHTNEGDIVLDCFSGSGTTALAAYKLGRRYIACDSHLPYVELSRQRLTNADPYQNSILKTGEKQLSLFASLLDDNPK